MVATSFGVGYLAGNAGERTVTSTSVVTSRQTTVSSITARMSSSSSLGPAETSDYNSSLGVELTMTLGNNTISQSDGISMYLSLENTLERQNNLSLNLGVEPNPPRLMPCSPLPFGVAIFEGNYEIGNLSEGNSLGRLWGPNTPVNCPTYGYNIFMPPMSGEFGTFASGNSVSVIPASTNMTYWGYWTYDAGDVFQSFSPGVYTIEGEDWWGQATLLHFQVVQNQNPLDCATIASDSPYVGYTNATTDNGPLKLNTYYLNPRMSDRVILALTNTGNSTLTTTHDTGSVGFFGFSPGIFNPDSTLSGRWQYYGPNGTLGFPAIFYPDQCVLIVLTLSSSYPQFPFRIYFSNNMTQEFTFTP